jgi:hypothetical protein
MSGPLSLSLSLSEDWIFSYILSLSPTVYDVFVCLAFYVLSLSRFSAFPCTSLSISVCDVITAPLCVVTVDETDLSSGAVADDILRSQPSLLPAFRALLSSVTAYILTIFAVIPPLLSLFFFLFI